MKKIMMIAAMMVAALTASAQNEAGKMAVGVQANYGLHKDYKNFGVGAKFQYNLTEEFRLEAAGNYFFKKDYVSMWDGNVNVQYVIPIADKLNVYPFVGATVLGAKFHGGDLGFGGSFNDFLLQNGISASDIATLQQYAPAQYNQLRNQYEELNDVVEDNSSETKFGINAGAGIEYFISDNFKINAEVKYQYVKDYDRPVIAIGAAYVF